MLKHLLLAVALAIWLPVDAAHPGSPAVALSPEEKTYVEHVKAVKMCVDPDWAPFERINAQGQHEGIAADLVQLVAQRVGLSIELYPTTTWEESLAASKAGRCQLMSFLNRSPARDAWLIFTDPIFFDQNIIITREEHPNIDHLQGVQGKSVALPRGTMVEERIRKDYPGLRVVTTASESEAITLVSERKVDMTVRSLIVAAHAIKKEGLFNLKVAGQMPEYTNQLRIGVIQQEPVLRNILDKGVQSITPQERESVVNRHVAIQVHNGIDYGLIWQGGLLGAVVVLVMLYWNRKLAALNKRLEQLSVTDKLTGLFNRQKLDVKLEMEFLRARRSGAPLSVIILDLDHFKNVNDTWGHQVGDQVLVCTAQLLTARLRQTDCAGRWGGEEFMVICPDTDLEGARALAETLRQAIAAQIFPTAGHQTASFGVACCTVGDQVKTLVSRADQALYEAKHLGRNRVEAG